MRFRKAAGAMLLVATLPRLAEAQSEEPPEVDFFEYLGSWQEEDEEWFIDAEIDARVPQDEPDAQRTREGDEVNE
jgi:hypothetical protein